jgi:hypothetical protein
MISFRIGVRPDSVQAFGGTLSSRLPTPAMWVWLSIGLRTRRASCRGVAPEGTAQLVVAMPASRSPVDPARKGQCYMKVFIGVDPHKLSVTIEVVDDHETVLATGRFSTDNAGYTSMLKHFAAWPGRV